MAKRNVATEDLDLYTRAAVSIDPALIREEYIRLPADLAHWNARHAAAHERYLEADLMVDKVTARLSMEYRARLASEGKVTEPMVKEHVEADQRWIDARVARLEAEADKVRVRGVVDAVLAKKEMLISLGAQIRAELNDPRIRQQAADAAHHGG